MIFQLLFSKLIDFIQLRKYSKYQQLFGHPREAQIKSLKLILERTAGCTIRGQLGIDQVSSLEDFQSKCPITTYEDYEKLTNELFNKKNTSHVLNTQRPSYFIATSGTSSHPKTFPVTEFYREEFQRVFLAWLGAIKKKRPQAFAGKTLYLADATIVGHSPTGVPYGVLSGYNFRKIPKALRKILYCTHEHFYELGDDRKKDITLLAHALSSRVTNIGTVMPETIFQFIEKFFIHGQDVVTYMKEGFPPFEYPKEFKKSMQLVPNQEAISRVEKILAKGKWESIHEFFPELNTIICWKGATAKFYFDKLKPYLSDQIVVWDAIYSASEGVFNLPDDPDRLGGPLAIDGNFLEFRECTGEEVSSDNRLLLAHELELGKEYEVFCTTSMGLFRYQIKDKIKVTDFKEETPVVTFVEKMGLWLNFAMERITTTHVCELIEKIKSEFDIDDEGLSYFTMCPCEKKGKRHYLLIVEAAKDEAILKGIAAQDLDQLFFEINPNYKRNVAGGLLGPLRLKVLAPGHLKKELMKRESSGQTMAQFKYSPIERDLNLAARLCPCCD